VQQTLWRVYVPAEDVVIRYDRTFSQLDGYQADQLIGTLGAGQPSAVAFKLAAQGRRLDFLRQGAPGTLTITIMGKEMFSIIVWVLVLAAGAVMLRMRGFTRILVILGVVLLGLVVELWAPMLVVRVWVVSFWAVAIVLMLWLAQWVFFRLPQWKKDLDARKAAGASASAVTDQASTKE
jgi:hypothetical protein